VTELLIERGEVVALLFNVATSRSRSRRSNDFSEATMKRKKLTKAELEEMKERHERVLANAERTRKLAEKAQAKLDAQRSGE
jgi:hypothetical protein